MGRLIPLKGCDLPLRGEASLLRRRDARFTVIRDRPERMSLQHLTHVLEIEGAVTFYVG